MNLFNNSQNHDEVDELIGALSKESSIPDEQFRAKLKTRILKKLNQFNLFFNFFVMNRTLKIAGVFATFALIAAVGSVATFTYLNQPRIEKISNQELLSKVLENNSPNVINSKSFNTQIAANAENLTKQESLDTNDNLGAGDLYNYSAHNYYYSKTKTGKGDAKDPCMEDQGLYYNLVVNGTNEYYTFFEDGAFYSKMISRDSENNLYSYNLSTNNSNINYLGGKYAIETIYDNSNPVVNYLKEPQMEGEVVEGVVVEGEADPAMVQEKKPAPPAENYVKEEPQEIRATDPEIPEVSKEDRIRNMFGEDINVEIVRENGKDCYVIISHYNSFCGPITLGEESSETREFRKPTEPTGEVIYHKNWVEPSNFQIVKTESYLEEIEPQNLITRTTHETENKDVSFEEVADKFKFEFDVEIKKVEIPKYDPIAEQEKLNEVLREELQDQELYLLKPTKTGMLINGIYSSEAYKKITPPDPTAEYYKDRDLYPEGEIGDEMYKASQLSYDPSVTEDPNAYFEAILNFDYSMADYTSPTINFGIYDEDIDKVTKQMIGNDSPDSTKTEKKVKIQIGKESVDAVLYEIKYSYNDVIPMTGESEARKQELMASSSTSYSYYVIFEYENYVYGINLSNYTEKNVTGEFSDKELQNLLIFEAYDPNNDNDMTKIDAILEEITKRRGREAVQVSDEPVINY